MEARRSDRPLIVGIGNPDRGDDGAGRVVACLAARSAPTNVAIVETDGEATRLLSLLEGAPAAFLVDACVSGAPVGAVHRFDAAMGPLPERLFGVSTHGFGVAEAVELARALDRLPPLCVVYAIEGGCFDTGAPLSPEVGDAVGDVARRLLVEVADLEMAVERTDA